MADVQMPQLGETVTEGTITKWFKKVGDQVAEDEVLFEVSTDKVDSEVPSPVAGYLAEIQVPEGDTVDVGTVLAVVDRRRARAPAPAPPPPPPPPAAGPAPEPATRRRRLPAAAPAAATAAAPAPPPPAAGPPRPRAGSSAGRRRARLLSPVVRRLSPSTASTPTPSRGTGRRAAASPAATCDAAIESGWRRRAPPLRARPAAPAARRAAAAGRPGPAPRSGTGDTVEPLNKIRRLTGEHMVHVEGDLAARAHRRRGRLRERRAGPPRAPATRAAQAEGFSLTYLPFISRAVVDALARVPAPERHASATAS